MKLNNRNYDMKSSVLCVLYCTKEERVNWTCVYSVWGT